MGASIASPHDRQKTERREAFLNSTPACLPLIGRVVSLHACWQYTIRTPSTSWRVVALYVAPSFIAWRCAPDTSPRGPGLHRRFAGANHPGPSAPMCAQAVMESWYMMQ